MAPADPHRDRLAGLGRAPDAAVGLAETALLLAALDRPLASVEDYLEIRDALAGELRAGGSGSAAERAHALAKVMAGRHRFRGDEQDDDEVSNANLMWVMDHRRGVAEALGVLYIDTARAAGWHAEGLRFPPRFLVRLEDGGGGRVIVDPFAGGEVVEPVHLREMLKATSGLASELEPGLWEPVANRAVLVRLQNDVKLRLLRCGKVERALAVVEAVLLFAPNEVLLWREAGMMNFRLGRFKAAIAALEQFVARTPNQNARRRTLQVLQDIRLRLS